MAQQINNEKLLFRYLLGEASEQEQIRIEEEYFAVDDTFQLMLAAEDDLIDAYVSGELSPHERKLFEARFLTTPRRRQQIEFAGCLKRSISGHPVSTETVTSTSRREVINQERVSWWDSLLALFGSRQGFGLAFAAVVVVMVLGGAGLLVLRQQSEPQPEVAQRTDDSRQREAPPPTNETRAQSDQSNVSPEQNRSPRSVAGEQAASRRQPTARPGGQSEHRATHPKEPTAQPRQPRSFIASFLLTPGLVRSGAGEANKLAIPGDVNRVLLRLALGQEDTYRGYQALLQTAEGVEVWRNERILKARTDQTVELTLPARLLNKGDYTLTLSGINIGGAVEEITEYSFTVRTFSVSY